MDNEALNSFAQIVGEENLLQSSVEKLAVNVPWRQAKPSGEFLAVVDFASVEQLQEIVEYCNQHNIGIVMRAGGTSLSQGSSIVGAAADKPMIIVRDAREPEFKIHADGTAEIIGNVTARDIEEAQDKWMIPTDLAIASEGDARGTATIIGGAATDARGSGAAAKGSARDMILQMQVVMADGRLKDLPSRVRGAPVIDDVVGMGGTTALITSLKVQLIRKPRTQAVAVFRVDDMAERYEILERMKAQCWKNFNLYEYMSEDLFELVSEKLGREEADETTRILASGKGDVMLVELTSPDAQEDLLPKLEKLLEGKDAVMARDKTQADWLLGYRKKHASTAGSGYATETGGKLVSFDISVPSGDVDELPSKALREEIAEKFDGVRFFDFGHAAGVVKIDANTPKGGTAGHFNLYLPPKFANAESAQWITDKVNAEIAARGGKIVSEHGIGRKYVAAFKEHHPQEYAEILATKARLDPKNILNPDVNVAAEDVAKLNSKSI